MYSRLLPRLLLPLLLAAGTVALSPLFRTHQPPLQSHAQALLLSATVALSLYLFTAIVNPEKF